MEPNSLQPAQIIPRIPRRLVILIGLAVLLLLGFWIYTTTKFHVVKTNPKTNSVAYFAPFFKVHFNNELSKEGLSVNSSENIIISYDISGKTLEIIPKEMKKDRQYTITINSIANTKGDKLFNKSFTFTARDLDPDSLPEDQKQALLKNQDKKTPELRDPIMSNLPHGTLTYNLVAEINAEGKLILQAELLLAASDVRGGTEAAVIEQYKAQVTDYIRSLGLDPAKYEIVYSVTQPSLY